MLFSVKQSKSPSRVMADGVTDGTKSSQDVLCEMYVISLSRLRTQQNYECDDVARECDENYE